MLLIRHYVAGSRLQGAGLFCAEPVNKGQVVYRYDARFVVVIPDEELRAMPEAMQEAVLKYSFRRRGDKRLTGAVYFCADDARFMNHADRPNTIWVPQTDEYVAAQDLPAHTELTCDYRDFCEPEEFAWDRPHHARAPA